MNVGIIQCRYSGQVNVSVSCRVLCRCGRALNAFGSRPWSVESGHEVAD